MARWVLLLCDSFQILQLHLIIREVLAGELARIEAVTEITEAGGFETASNADVLSSYSNQRILTASISDFVLFR